MTPIFATTPSIVAPSLSSWPKTPPQIVTTASANNSPWLYSALMQVRDIEHSGELIPGLGDIRIAEPTAMRARILLGSIETANLPAPVVSPVSGGGLSITWTLGVKELKFSFEPNGQTTYYKVIDDEIADDGAIDQIARKDVDQQIQWMLRGEQ